MSIAAFHTSRQYYRRKEHLEMLSSNPGGRAPRNNTNFILKNVVFPVTGKMIPFTQCKHNAFIFKNPLSIMTKAGVILPWELLGLL